MIAARKIRIFPCTCAAIRISDADGIEPDLLDVDADQLRVRARVQVVQRFDEGASLAHVVVRSAYLHVDRVYVHVDGVNEVMRRFNALVERASLDVHGEHARVQRANVDARAVDVILRRLDVVPIGAGQRSVGAVAAPLCVASSRLFLWLRRPRPVARRTRERRVIVALEGDRLENPDVPIIDVPRAQRLGRRFQELTRTCFCNHSRSAPSSVRSIAAPYASRASSSRPSLPSKPPLTA